MAKHRWEVFKELLADILIIGYAVFFLITFTLFYLQGEVIFKEGNEWFCLTICYSNLVFFMLGIDRLADDFFYRADWWEVLKELLGDAALIFNSVFLLFHFSLISIIHLVRTYEDILPILITEWIITSLIFLLGTERLYRDIKGK